MFANHATRLCFPRFCLVGISLTITALATALMEPTARTATGQEVTTSDPDVLQPKEASEGSSSPEALAAYAKAANLQNNGAFDLAVEAWEQFLRDHATDAMAIEAQYNLGTCQLQLKAFDAARDALRQVVESNRDFDRIEDAYLNLGRATYSLALQNQPKLFAEADQVFEQLLTKFPQSEFCDQALFFRGESLYLQGKRTEAAEIYQELVDDYGDSKLRADALYALGVTFEELSRHEEAGKVYDEYLEKFGDHSLAAEVRLRSAETVLQGGDFAKAERLFDQIAQADGGENSSADHARYRQAYCVARQERYPEAAELFAAIPAKFPQSKYVPDATMAAARAFYRADQVEPAAKWFDKALQLPLAYAAEAAHWRARLYLKANAAEAAYKLVTDQLTREGIQQHPFYANLMLDQVDALHAQPDRRAETIDQYAAIASQFPQHVLAPQALYNASFAALELKDYRRSLSLAQEFLNKYPEHRLLSDVKHVIAESQLQLGEGAAAAETFSELAKANEGQPQSGQLRLRHAAALYAQKKYGETIRELQEQLGSLRDPETQAEAYYWIGMSQLSLQKYEQAKQALNRSLEVEPRWRQADEVLLTLSRVLRRLKDPAGAKAAVQKVLDDFPESTLRDQAHYRLAEALYASGDYGPAIKHYQRVIQDWPKSSFVPFALYGLGWSQLRATDPKAAQASFSKLLNQYPDHTVAAQSLYARAMCRQQLGDYAASLKDVEQFLATERTPRETSDARYVQALCYVGQKAWKQAIPVLQSIIDDDPDYPSNDKVLYELAWASKTSDQSDVALQAFQKLARDFSSSPLAAEASYHIGEQAYEKGQHDQAVAAYQKAAEGLKNATTDLGEKIYYKLGWSQYQRQNFEAAEAAFGEQIAKFPRGELVGDAYFMQGECRFKANQHQDALRLYEQAIERPLSSEQIETLTRLHAGQSAGQLQKWQESLNWLTELIKKFPDSPILLQATFESGVAQQQLGQSAEALRSFTSVADRAVGELSARARFMVGEVYYAQKDYNMAVREFRKVMYGFDAQVGPEIQRWQAKAGFEAGQCAGVLASQQSNPNQRREYIELAMKFFEYVQTRHPDSREAEAAAEQLKKYGS